MRLRIKGLPACTLAAVLLLGAGPALATGTPAPPPATRAPTVVAPVAPVTPVWPDGITVSLGNFRQTFVPTKLSYLTQAYVKLTGVDLSDDKLIDDFATVNYCSIVQQYYQDEFAWRQAREAVRNIITRNLETYPEYFYITGTLPIGRYDFERKAFVLDPQNQMRRTGLFRITDRKFDCGRYTVDRMPVEYNFRLTNPVTLDHIEMPEQKAFEITRRMDTDANSARIAYVVFYLRVNDFSTMGAGGVTGVDATMANVRATLLSMRLYLDRDRKYQIYEYTDN